MRKLQRFPFDPAKAPFFYGWIILAAGTIGMLMSAPGQTVGVSVFTDFLIDALSLSRRHLSLTYLVGTTASALLLTRAGKFYDRAGARTMVVVVSLGLAGVLVYLSFTPAVSRRDSFLLRRYEYWVLFSALFRTGEPDARFQKCGHGVV